MGIRYTKDGKKIYTINVRLQPFLYEWLKEKEKEGRYGNISDIVRTALLEFKRKIEEEEKEQQSMKTRILDLLSKDENLRKEILEVLEKEK